MSDNIKVFVTGTTSENSGSYTWYHTREAADEQFEKDRAIPIDWKVHRFDLYVTSLDSAQYEVEEYWNEHF